MTLRARSPGGRSVHGTPNGIQPGSWTPSTASWASASSSVTLGSRSSSRGVRSRTPYIGQWETVTGRLSAPPPAAVTSFPGVPPGAIFMIVTV
jgi:hypothetical protein